MTQTLPAVRLDLHCHSSFSDGSCSPEQLAEKLAGVGVGWASLVDHETTRGLARFEAALQQYGIQFLPGTEIEVRSLEGPIHLLAYGFDPASAALQRYLASLRHPLWHSALRRLRRERHSANGYTQAASAIAQIHQAGGIAVLAHPLDTLPDAVKLEEEVARLAAWGVDALEAYYRPYTPAQQEMLAGMAARHNLLVSAGSDFHGERLANGNAIGTEMPAGDWERLREKMADRQKAALAKAGG